MSEPPMSSVAAARLVIINLCIVPPTLEFALQGKGYASNCDRRLATVLASPKCTSERDNSHIEISACTVACRSRTGCAHGRTQGLSAGSPGDTSRGFRPLGRQVRF